MSPRPSLLRCVRWGEAAEELWGALTVPCDITIMQPERREPKRSGPGSPQGEVGGAWAVPGLPGPLSVQFARGRPLGRAPLALALSFVLPQLSG